MLEGESASAMSVEGGVREEGPRRGPSNILNSPTLGDEVRFISWKEPWSLLLLHGMFGLLPVAAGPAWETKPNQTHTCL